MSLECIPTERLAAMLESWAKNYNETPYKHWFQHDNRWSWIEAAIRELKRREVSRSAEKEGGRG